ncbi:MAG: hypothetical protein A2860_02120 [Candidatus Levybacteria bacterium RIFCSPHIGHO2_01_FULL_37_33]|nr:MAG: hypothetical protein A2860_02120 [Candidatus Levybacteria bacterium RIFCSPHIGHO2_01_FULL_37_33]OGH32662.1 MAG: hypothetical protein A2953_01380 [Candidatus Levybacteria bacterium RIFCSPLOWO2_01_FULL_36_54]
MQKGQSLIELLLTIALVSIFFPALLTGFVSTRNNRTVRDQRQQASAYLNEAQEAIRVIRANGWSNLSAGTYHPIVSGSTWILTSAPELIDGNFTRSIIIEDVKRDSNGDIAQSGTLDPSTKLLTISVLWNSPFPNSVSAKSYLTRHNNAVRTDTTIADFSGTVQGATVSATTGSSVPNDGQVQLGAGGGGDWCLPNLSIASLDLPKNGVSNAIFAIEGKAFAGTGDNSSGISYASVTISNTHPPVAIISGTFDGFKTNDGIFGEADYAYLATDNNSKEIEIVDITHTTNGKYSEAGYFNAPGNGTGNSVFVLGDIGYMTDGNQLYTFDLSSKFGSRPQLGSVTLAGTGKKVYVVGSYAYVAISEGTLELQVIQVGSGGRALTIVGQADVNGHEASDVFVNSTGTRVYLATESSSSQKEFFIIDVSTKTGNRPTVGSYEANGMNPKGVTVVPGNKALLVGIGGEEYQVINISNETSPTRCGGLNIESGVNGISSVLEQDGDTYSYIITGDAQAELKIIEGAQFATSGTYTSPIFDAGSDAYFNSFTVNHIIPPPTSMQYEVAVAAAVNNSCSDAIFSYAGPFATSSALPSTTVNPSYQNPGRCLRYKVTLSTSDITQMPILSDITINYSP